MGHDLPSRRDQERAHAATRGAKNHAPPWRTGFSQSTRKRWSELMAFFEEVEEKSSRALQAGTPASFEMLVRGMEKDRLTPGPNGKAMSVWAFVDALVRARKVRRVAAATAAQVAATEAIAAAETAAEDETAADGEG